MGSMGGGGEGNGKIEMATQREVLFWGVETGKA